MEFTQRTNKYHNNEFDNMPSIDYYDSSYRLGHFNKETIDWDEVGRIVKSFGLEYVLISRTFSDSFIDVVVYHKIEDGDDLPAYCHLLHNCIHELDLKTNLYWRTSWNGNVGIFGSNDVKRQTYSFGDRIWKWKNILNNWESSIHDTKRVLKEGDYLLMDTSYGKIKHDNVFTDFNIVETIEYIRSIAPSHKVALENGKRLYDKYSFDAVVIRNSNDQYCGLLKFDKDVNDVVNVIYATPLCGESEVMLRKSDWKEQVKNMVNFVVS